MKDLLLSQRQEISWKNEDMKNLESKVATLSQEIYKLDNMSEGIRSEAISHQTDKTKMEELIKTVEDLLEKNNDNQKIIERLKTESLQEFWEEKISDLNKEIIDLKAQNEAIRIKEGNLENKTREIELENQITDLKNQIAELKEENDKIEEKNRMLKAALLMTVDSETKNVTDTPTAPSDDKIIEDEDSEMKKTTIKEGPVSAEISTEEMQTSERKRICPNCGAAGAFILEVDDKSNVIYQDMGTKIYGKKYKCGDCRHEWK